MPPVQSAADRSPFKQIPIIDLTNVESSDPAVRRRLVDEVKDACTRVGFFYVKNHGIPETVFERTLDAMRLFFDLLLDLKLEIENNNSPNFKGYSAILSGNNDPNGAGDLQEGFEFGYEVVDGPSRKEPQDDVMSAPNVWPAALPEFRTAALDYYHHALRLGGQIFPLFALALDLPHDFFADKVRVASGTSSRDGRTTTSHPLYTVLSTAAASNDTRSDTANIIRYRQSIPSCISPERPAKYEVITAGEYIQAHLKAT